VSDTPARLLGVEIARNGRTPGTAARLLEPIKGFWVELRE
jgi:hypothetical protein